MGDLSEGTGGTGPPQRERADLKGSWAHGSHGVTVCPLWVARRRHSARSPHHGPRLHERGTTPRRRDLAKSLARKANVARPESTARPERKSTRERPSPHHHSGGERPCAQRSHRGGESVDRGGLRACPRDGSPRASPDHPGGPWPVWGLPGLLRHRCPDCLEPRTGRRRRPLLGGSLRSVLAHVSVRRARGGQDRCANDQNARAIRGPFSQWRRPHRLASGFRPGGVPYPRGGTRPGGGPSPRAPRSPRASSPTAAYRRRGFPSGLQQASPTSRSARRERSSSADAWSDRTPTVSGARRDPAAPRTCAACSSVLRCEAFWESFSALVVARREAADLGRSFACRGALLLLASPPLSPRLETATLSWQGALETKGRATAGPDLRPPRPPSTQPVLFRSFLRPQPRRLHTAWYTEKCVVL